MTNAEDEPEGPDAPASDVAEELGSIERELSSLAATRPLLSSTFSAQIERALNQISTQIDLPDFSTVGLEAIQAQLARSVAFDTSRLFESIQRSINTPSVEAALRRALKPSFDTFLSLTDPRTYENPDPPKATYSEAMKSPGSYFANDEHIIDSFGGLTSAIESLIAKVPRLQLVWRGHRDADWGIHSALFRKLLVMNGVKPPTDLPRGEQPYPDERQMVEAERVILRAARAEWRFDGMSALETFARIQHSGGPTRLLDVTKNPFIGAWFAVESHDGDDNRDGRLIAFATTPVHADEKRIPPSQISLDDEWGDLTPAWHAWNDSVARQSVDWGTGARRRLWVPPAYDPRISAQNAAFILDGVPITSRATQPYFKSRASAPQRYWTRADLLAAGSIFIKTFKPNRRPRSNKNNFAPTFTFRIRASAKKEILRYLTDYFGYTTSYIYPDMPALAAYVENLDFPGLDDRENAAR